MKECGKECSKKKKEEQSDFAPKNTSECVNWKDKVDTLEQQYKNKEISKEDFKEKAMDLIQKMKESNCPLDIKYIEYENL